MTQPELMQRVRLHNAAQAGLVVLLVPLAVGLWFLSYYIFRYVFDFVLNGLEESRIPIGMPAAALSHYIALGGIVLLATDGFRYKDELFDLGQFSQSSYAYWMRPGRHNQEVTHHAALGAYVISQMLFCAPRSVVEIVRALRSWLPMDEPTVAQAAKILEHLRRSRAWESIDQFQNMPRAIVLLLKTKRLWIREEHEGFQVRFPPGDE